MKNGRRFVGIELNPEYAAMAENRIRNAVPGPISFQSLSPCGLSMSKFTNLGATLRVLSLCTSAGLWDKAWLEAGHQVIPGCEIMPHKRAMYEAFCGGTHLCEDLANLPPIIRGQHFDGIIGGIPCQSRSKLRAIREPKFPDLLPHRVPGPWV